MATKVQAPNKRHEYVTDKEFEEILKGRFKISINISKEEAEAMKNILGSTQVPIKPEDFKVGFDSNCKRCSKQLTFFDIFITGITVHGVPMINTALFGPQKIVGYYDGNEHLLKCSSCGNPNSIISDDYYAMQYYCCGKIY